MWFRPPASRRDTEATVTTEASGHVQHYRGLFFALAAFAQAWPQTTNVPACLPGGREAGASVRVQVSSSLPSALAYVVSLRPLLRPRGDQSRPHSWIRGAGRVFVVPPQASVITGVRAYRSVAALPQVPDLAVVTVPAAAVPQVARECGEAGVHALLVVSAGLGANLAEDLMNACRRHGMRLVGPNCLGLANTEDAVRLDATCVARHRRPGAAGIAVQSGGAGIALLDGRVRLGIGGSTFVSLDDKYDVSGNDLLQWWEADGHTDLALLYLESFGNPGAFSRTARRVARTLPVLTVGAGRSAAGRRGATSHTAAAATPTMTRRRPAGPRAGPSPAARR